MSLPTPGEWSGRKGSAVYPQCLPGRDENGDFLTLGYIFAFFPLFWEPQRIPSSFFRGQRSVSAGYSSTFSEHPQCVCSQFRDSLQLLGYLQLVWWVLAVRTEGAAASLEGIRIFFKGPCSVFWRVLAGVTGSSQCFLRGLRSPQRASVDLFF